MNKLGAALLAILTLIAASCSSREEGLSKLLGPRQSVAGNLTGYASQPGAHKIIPGTKTFEQAGVIYTDRIFTDGLGREIYFRGFNTSGSVKLVETGFKPFKTTTDAAASFNEMGRRAGANIVRFTIGWEGVHPAVDTIDTAYLDAIVAQMKEAIRNNIYILVDYHQDLFSRHLFNQNSWHTGNGAPAWVMQGYPEEYCGVICVMWGQNLLTNEAVRKAFRNFWNNVPIATSAGARHLQTEYIWQLGQAMQYIKNHLTADEFDFIAGIDPLNEPTDGGTEGLSFKEWDNQKLWPFHQRVRAELNLRGWQDKPVFAEPLVFWNSEAGFVAPATGGHHLDYKPGDGFVFNSHFYDTGRMGINDSSTVRNGAYFTNIDLIRDEARFLEVPAIVTEFGMAVDATGYKDGTRIRNGVYQALEISDTGAKNRHASLYAPVVSSIEWHWDFYYNNHHEYMNGNPNKLLTETDAWNDENFSVVKDYATGYNFSQNLIERAYVRASQGRLINMYYNALPTDAGGSLLSWGMLRTSLAGASTERPYLSASPTTGKKFLFAAWQGRYSDAPSEIFIPRHFDLTKLVVVTDKRVYNKTLVKDAASDGSANEVLLVRDPAKALGSGSLVLVSDTAEADENAASLHFALVFEDASTWSAAELETLRTSILYTMNTLRQNPVYLATEMTKSGYANEFDAAFFELKYGGRCMDVSSASTSDGTTVRLWDCNGSDAQRWRYDAATGYLVTKLNANKCLDAGATATNGASLTLRTCAGANRFRFDWDGSSLRTRLNNTYAVDATGMASGSAIVLWQYHGGYNQQWRMVFGESYFQLKHAGRCMDVANASTSDGTSVRLWNCNGSDAQRWFYDAASGYVVSKLNQTKCLDVGTNVTNGANLVLRSCGTENRYRFNWAGKALLNRQNTSYALDAAGTAQGSAIRLWQGTGNINQMWNIAY